VDKKNNIQFINPIRKDTVSNSVRKQCQSERGKSGDDIKAIEEGGRGVWRRAGLKRELGVRYNFVGDLNFSAIPLAEFRLPRDSHFPDRTHM
jgi:hypothetical protein